MQKGTAIAKAAKAKKTNQASYLDDAGFRDRYQWVSFLLATLYY